MKEEDFSAFLQLQEQEEEVFKRERYLERLKKRIKELGPRYKRNLRRTDDPNSGVEPDH
jgi:hypothetical protein